MHTVVLTAHLDNTLESRLGLGPRRKIETTELLLSLRGSAFTDNGLYTFTEDSLILSDLLVYCTSGFYSVRACLPVDPRRHIAHPSLVHASLHCIVLLFTKKSHLL